MTDDWTISASKLKSHQRCGEEFRLKYIEGHEETGPPSRWIRRGNAVHEAIEDVLNDFESPSVGSAALKTAYKENGGQAGYTLSDEDHDLVLKSLEATSRYLRNHVDEICGIELEVEFGVDRADVWKDFGGYMDLATDSAVVDWKTGKSEGKAQDEALQGAVYMAGYAHEFGEPPEEITYVYVNPEHDDHPKWRTLDPDNELWEGLIGKARALLADVESGEFTADPAEDKCHFCNFQRFCTTSPVGAGNVDWRSYP